MSHMSLLLMRIIDCIIFLFKKTSLRTKFQWIPYEFTVWWMDCIEESYGTKQRNWFLFLHIMSTQCLQFYIDAQAFVLPHTSTSNEEICDRGVRSWVSAPNSLNPSALTACINSDCRWTILPFTLTYSLGPLSHLPSPALAYINIWSRFLCAFCLNKPYNAHKYGTERNLWHAFNHHCASS